MGRSVGKNNSKKGVSASGELVDRFAKMSLTPTISKSDVNKNKKKKKRKKNKKGIGKISSDKFVKKRGWMYNDKLYEAIPSVVYDAVKNAVDIMNRPGWPSCRFALYDLKIAEYAIDVCCRFCSDDLPLGWKYDRGHASSLIAGYR